MHSVAETRAPSRQRAQEVARKFITLFYRVLNNHTPYLYKFYGTDSTVVVCLVTADREPETTKAENVDTVRDLLCALYSHATVVVRSCTSQPSANGCISLLISGIIQQHGSNEGRAITQALILSQQDDGYYVRTDSTLMFPLGSSMPGAHTLLPSLSCTTGATTDMAETPLTSSHGTAAMTIPHDNYGYGKAMGRVCVMPLTDLIREHHPTEGGIFGDGSSRALKGDIDGGLNIRAGKDGIPTEGQWRSASSIPDNQSGIIQSMTKPCHLPNGRFNLPALGIRDNQVPAGSGIHDNLPSDAPGAVFVPHFPPRGIPGINPPVPCPPTTPPTNSGENTHRQTTDCKQLFVCKLPLGTTVEEVTTAFAQYGALSESDPVRVFTGPDNCYACVTYVAEGDVTKALEAQTQIGGKTVVTDPWRPRDKRPKRRRPDNSHEQKAIATAN